jgi:hypothetical protein
MSNIPAVIRDDVREVASASSMYALLADKQVRSSIREIGMHGVAFSKELFIVFTILRRAYPMD